MEDKIEFQMKCHDDTRHAIGFSELWCKLIGAWPWQRNKIFSRMRSACLMTVEVAASTLLLERLVKNGNCGSTARLIETLAAIMMFLVTVPKIFLPCFHRERMRNIIQLIIDDWSNLSEAKSRRLMIRYATWGRLAYIIQISAAFMIVLELIITRPPSFTVRPSENGNLSVRGLVFGLPCWIPPSMSTPVYLIYYYITLCGTCVNALMYIGFDSFMFSTALHICGQFEILNSSIEKITVQDNYGIRLKNRIKEYSQRHAKLFALTNQLNDIANLIVLFQLLSNGFLICLSGISLLTSVKSGRINNDDLDVGVRIYVCYMALFMYSFVGEKLSIQAEKSQIAVYNMEWYNMPTNIARDIQFIIMRNNSPCYLTACGVMTMNYEAFKNITRVIFSCFSVLKLVLE